MKDKQKWYNVEGAHFLALNLFRFITYLEYDDECQLQGQYLPVGLGVPAVVVPERPVPALRLVGIQPPVVGGNGQGEVDVASHVPIVLVFVHQLGDEVRSEGYEEGVGDDRELGQHVQDLEPNADIFCPFGHGSARFANELLGVQANFDPVIEQGEERRQRESRHEDGDEAELQHHLQVLLKEPFVLH